MRAIAGPAVKARAALIANMTASVPLLTKRTRSIGGNAGRQKFRERDFMLRRFGETGSRAQQVDDKPPWPERSRARE